MISPPDYTQVVYTFTALPLSVILQSEITYVRALYSLLIGPFNRFITLEGMRSSILHNYP